VLKFVQDAGWVSVVVAIVIALIGWYIQRRRKALSYEVVAKYPLVFVSDSDKGVEISYDGMVVVNPTILILRVRNSGNEPIRAGDFERRIQFSFGDASEIISASATDVSPSSLEVQLDVSERSVAVAPLLLNAGDAFSIKILLENHSTLQTSVRVAGVKEFIERREDDGDSKYLAILAVLVIASLAALAFYLPPAIAKQQAPWEAGVIAIVGLLASLIMLYRLILRRSRRLIRRVFFHDRS
jgi:hypothetical protein